MSGWKDQMIAEMDENEALMEEALAFLEDGDEDGYAAFCEDNDLHMAAPDEIEAYFGHWNPAMSGMDAVRAMHMDEADRLEQEAEERKWDEEYNKWLDACRAEAAAEARRKVPEGAHFSPAAAGDLSARDAIIGAIEAASRSIDLAIYRLTDRVMAAKLRAAAAKGLDVRIILDASPQGDDAIRTEECVTTVRAGGGEVKQRTGRKFGNWEGIMHKKSMVIDNSVLLFGSFNYTWSADNRNEEELVVLHHDDIRRKLQERFELMWKDAD